MVTFHFVALSFKLRLACCLVQMFIWVLRLSGQGSFELKFCNVAWILYTQLYILFYASTWLGKRVPCVLSCCSRVWLLVTPWTVACQAPLSMRFSRQEYWGGLSCPPPGDLPDPGTEPASHVSCIGRWVLYWEACVMVNFMHQHDPARECPDIWLNTILGVSMEVLPEEINIWISGLSKADFPPLSPTQVLEDLIEQKGWVRENF